MNGECKFYRLNEPMTWVEFKAMPDDIKVTYIKLLRQKFNVSVQQIAIMMGIAPSSLGKETRRLNLGEGKHSRGPYTQWDEAGWNKWIGKKMVSPEPVEESIPQEITEPFLEEDVSFPEEPNSKAEEPDHMEPVPVPCHEFKRAIPHSGNMDFEGEIGEVLETVAVLLGGAYAKVCISWEVYRPDGAEMEG